MFLGIVFELADNNINKVFLGTNDFDCKVNGVCCYMG